MNLPIVFPETPDDQQRLLELYRRGELGIGAEQWIKKIPDDDWEDDDEDVRTLENPPVEQLKELVRRINRPDETDPLVLAISRAFESAKVALTSGEAGLEVLKARLEGQTIRTAADPKAPRLGYRFNVVNPEAVAWAHKRAGDLVADVTATTRKAIRSTVSSILEGDVSWDDALEDLDDIFDDEERVKSIAHTEVMRAANEGQKGLWNQAVEDGLLDGDEKMVWIVTPDDKLCDICEAMDGEMTTLGEDFEEDGPPAHPNCRCTIGLQP